MQKLLIFINCAQRCFCLFTTHSLIFGIQIRLVPTPDGEKCCFCGVWIVFVVVEKRKRFAVSLFFCSPWELFVFAFIFRRFSQAEKFMHFPVVLFAICVLQLQARFAFLCGKFSQFSHGRCESVLNFPMGRQLFSWLCNWKIEHQHHVDFVTHNARIGSQFASTIASWLQVEKDTQRLVCWLSCSCETIWIILLLIKESIVRQLWRERNMSDLSEQKSTLGCRFGTTKPLVSLLLMPVLHLHLTRHLQLGCCKAHFMFISCEVFSGKITGIGRK